MGYIGFVVINKPNPMEHAAQILTDQNFSKEVIDFKGVVLVDFWAPWCGPCQAMAPHIEELAKKNADNSTVKIGKLDVDENQAISEKYAIMSIPSLKIFKDGLVVEELVGVTSPESLQQKLDSHR